MKINVNQGVKVVLTDYGVDVLRKRHYILQERIKKHLPKHEIEPFQLKLDSDGYYTAQLWILMEQFGDSMKIGGRIPFETTIIIES